MTPVFVVDDDPAILAYYRKLFTAGEDELDILGGDNCGEADGPGPARTCADEETRIELKEFSLPSAMLEAFRRAHSSKRPVPLCILDMRMPEKSGLDSALELRSIDPDVAIIICTAFSDASADTLHHRLRTGVFLVQKPFSADAFRLLVISLVREWQTRRKLASNEERLRRTIEATRAGTWEWLIPERRITFNDRFAELLGYGKEELELRGVEAFHDLFGKEDLETVSGQIERHFAGILPWIDMDVRMVAKDGRRVWVRVSGKVIEAGSEGRPRVMYGTIVDMSVQKAMEEQIREIAIRDALTGAFNRRHIFERLAELRAEYCRDGHVFSVAMLDIDHFKEVNDRHGHQAGDMVLSEFVRMISGNVRAYDLVGRYGGEEFLLICPGAGPEETKALVERMKDMLRAMVFRHGDAEIRFTFSAGVAGSEECTRECFDAEELVGRADERLYRAKAEGRDRVVGA